MLPLYISFFCKITFHVVVLLCDTCFDCLVYQTIFFCYFVFLASKMYLCMNGVIQINLSCLFYSGVAVDETLQGLF